jgi:prephenate dehydrogenase
MSKNVHIIGAGLLGGSIALALAEAGWLVSLEDANSQLTETSLAQLSMRNAVRSKEEVDVVIVAVPVSTTKLAISNALNLYPNATVIDIASVKTKSLPDVDMKSSKIQRFVSTHPFAGKELQGAENASVDLFKDRVWAICGGPYLSNASRLVAEAIIRDCGSVAVDVDLSEHDEIVGLTSHLPQILSTLLSRELTQLSENDLLLSGNGLRDMTRLASSSADLWSEIVVNNSQNIIFFLERLEKSLSSFKLDVEKSNFEQIKRYFEEGKSQRNKIPGKHGDPSKVYSRIEVQILDEPGELARIFSIAHASDVNIEDVRINHALGRNIAILEIYIFPDVAVNFAETLKREGCSVRSNVTQSDL